MNGQGAFLTNHVIVQETLAQISLVHRHVPELKLTDGFVITICRKPELAFKAVGGITGEVAGEDTGEVQRLLMVPIPGKPISSKQKYRLTQKGRDLIAKQAKEEKS